MNYKFILVDTASGADKDQWVLSPPVTFGRCPTADITVNEESISRKHCQFLIDPYGSLVVRDLGSKNGVYLDARRVDKAVITPGMQLQIGILTLRIELTDEELDQELENSEAEQVFDLDSYDLGETQKVKIIPPSGNGS